MVGERSWPRLNNRAVVESRPFMVVGAAPLGTSRCEENITAARGLATLKGRGLAHVAFPHPLRVELPVARLIRPLIALAGEALVVAFAGRTRSRRFDAGTLGMPLGTTTKTQPEGALIVRPEASQPLCPVGGPGLPRRRSVKAPTVSLSCRSGLQVITIGGPASSFRSASSLFWSRARRVDVYRALQEPFRCGEAHATGAAWDQGCRSGASPVGLRLFGV